MPRARRRTMQRDATTLPLIRAAIAAGRAAAGDLPRLPGTERRARRQPRPADPGPARPDRPFHPVGPALRRACAPARRMPCGWRRTARSRDSPAAPPSSRSTRCTTRASSGSRRAWWPRAGRRTARSRRCGCSDAPRLRPRRAMASRIRLGDGTRSAARCSRPSASAGAWAARPGTADRGGIARATAA